MPGTHFKNDSDQTGSQPRSSVIVYRSSFIVRSFVAHPSRPVQVIYRLSSIVYLASYASYAPYAPTLLTAPGVYLPIAHPSAADRYSAIRLAVSAEQGYHDTGEEKTGGRERESEKAKGRRKNEWRRRIRDPGPGIRDPGRTRAVITDASRSR